MKKILMGLMALVCSAMVMGQNPVMTFEKTEHNFGKIREQDGRVTTVFTFKNEGMTPLILNSVRASCGCTSPKWPKEPIEPGQTGEITVTYNPSGRPGRFQKTITINSNANEATKKIYIKGEVIPKPAKPINRYPVQMGALNLKSNTIDFGDIKKQDQAVKEIEFANLGDKDLTVDLYMIGEGWVAGNVTLPKAQANETGNIQLAILANECPIYGPVTAKAYIVVNGEKHLTDDYLITATANIVEDFSTLTPEQMMAAPIVEVEHEQMGVVGKKDMTATIEVKNVGVNTMYVRRVLTEPNAKVVAPRTIKSGKKAVIKIVMPMNEEKHYDGIVTLITNDPNNPVQELHLVCE